ncbi:MaoC family dehydratase N-terminal domain-containing protein [Sphingobium sp. Sx8-8]|uniref:FAS1-like dehydratase domain-containing protein n=1 Tax=Sphingobium sp. Sx8-8 TaxID=2933617 RepID=UPI001F57B374|nr:MaoC family dehydratase N-terminal domain-containing protein [Sphingobium sp. Sx8-8]
MSESYLTPEIMATVGEKTVPRRGVITADHFRRFAVGVDDTNPLYTDVAAARAAGYRDVISPPLFNAAVTRPHPFRDGLLGDGQYESVAPPGLGHLQTMLAGQSWELIRPTHPGEELIETFTTTSITEKQGKTGNMVFVEKEATLATPDGEVVERYGNTLILRAPPPPLPPYQGETATPAAMAGAGATELSGDVMVKNPDMITLFMFCASIWAVHRIHWDAPYAQREGLKLPILPGWLVASYLAQLATLRAPEDERLTKLSARYRSSAYPGDRLTCTGEGSGSSQTLQVANADGVVLVTADATTAPRFAG